MTLYFFVKWNRNRMKHLGNLAPVGNPFQTLDDFKTVIDPLDFEFENF